MERIWTFTDKLFSSYDKRELFKKFDNFPWKKNDKLLKSWKDGLTGYPIVDAGMRELYKRAGCITE